MLKKLLYFFSFMSIVPTCATLGPHLLNNSPSAYLLDIDLTFLDPATTRQIGNELYERDYIATVITYAAIPGSFIDRPMVPGPGSSFADGQWVWIPNALNSDAGIWYWILRPRPYYLVFLASIIHPF